MKSTWYIGGISFLLLCVMMMAIPAQSSPTERSLCVFDVVGTNGPIYQSMKRYQAAALKWDVKLQLKPYTDEIVALEDFQAGQCDGVVVTGVRNRNLVKFAGSIDMMGALPTFDHLEQAIQALSKPRAKSFLRNGQYETAGILPAGTVYFFVRPDVMEHVDGTPSINDFAGKEVAVLSHDQQAITAVRTVGGTVVRADVSNFAGTFNNGNVDMCYAPATAYEALELYRGLGKNGGIVDYPLAQMTYQIVLHHEKFPGDFGQKSRNWAVDQFDTVKKRLMGLRNEIPESKWIRIPEKRYPEYREVFRQIRQKLLDQGVYHPKMVKFLRKIRCKMNPGRAECTR